MLTVCLASSQEASSFFKAVPAGGAVRAVVTGFANRLADAALRDAHGDFMIVGFAGALNPAFLPGSLLVPHRVGAPGKPALTPDPFLRSSFMDALLAEKIPFQDGSLLTVDAPVAKTD